jgi:hypothetical protein
MQGAIEFPANLWTNEKAIQIVFVMIVINSNSEIRILITINNHKSIAFNCK